MTTTTTKTPSDVEPGTPWAQAETDKFTASDYRHFVKSRQTNFPTADNLMHFASGIAVEYGEYDACTDDDEALLELGDILFYATALANTVLSLKSSVHKDNEYWLNRAVVDGAHPSKEGNGRIYNGLDCFLNSGSSVYSLARMEINIRPLEWGRRPEPLSEMLSPLERIFKWRFHSAQLQLLQLVKDLDLILWELEEIAESLHDTTLLEVMRLNVLKLVKRHPEEFRGVAWKNDGPAT